MKSRIALWGKNTNSQKFLCTLELDPNENKIHFQAIPEADVNDELEEQIFKSWRTGGELTFPASTDQLKVDLTQTDQLMPDAYIADNPDIINQARAEWKFLVLSTKFTQLYRSELDEIKDKIHQADEFKDHMWDDLKSFWDKVQEQVRERTLLREHTNELRESTNELFNHLRKMRTQLEATFKTTSKSLIQPFLDKLEEINKKIDEGGRFNALFDELKGIQNQTKEMKLSREARAHLWEQLDTSFKKVKEKRSSGENSGGDQKNANGPDRIKGRLDGLLEAIKKMETSIQRDRNEMEFQNKRIDQSGGQLEAQLRGAKLSMIEERIKSKENKLAEMHATRMELEKRMEQQAERQRKREEEAKKAEMTEAAKEKIAQQIKEDIKQKQEAVEKKIVHPKSEANGSSSNGSAKEAQANGSDEISNVIQTIAAITEEKK